MGLDAVVFRNIRSVRTIIKNKDLQEDPHTGEASDASNQAELPGSTVRAVHKRLGNTAQIGHLRDRLRKFLDPHTSIILRKIVYSGAHAGDAIPLGEMSELRAELDAISASSNPDIRNFVKDMTELTDAALRERNPIVFT